MISPRFWIACRAAPMAIARRPGRQIRTSEIVRVFTVRDGKDVMMRSFFDTAAYVAAIRGE